MRPHVMPATIAAFCALTIGGVSAVELKPATLASFDRYVRLTDARISREIDGASPFLWIDRQPDRERAALLARLKQGEVVSERLETRDGSKRIDVNDGLIHHWIGTVLLPGAPLARVTTFVQGYERYAELFTPTIQRSRVVNKTGDQFTVAMRTYMKKVTIEVVIDADYRVDYRAVSKSRLYTKSVATNIFEVKSAGEPGEERTPGDQTTRGYLRRLNTYCSFEERPEGTYEQCESISLTGSIPFGLGWLVKPFVNGIPRQTLEFTLGRVRTEMLKPAGSGR